MVTALMFRLLSNINFSGNKDMVTGFMILFAIPYSCCVLIDISLAYIAVQVAF